MQQSWMLLHLRGYGRAGKADAVQEGRTWDSKAHAGVGATGGVDGGVDANHAATGVQQGAAAVAWT